MKPVIEVFRTNIQNELDAAIIKKEFFKVFPYVEITFDLEDCDRVLRISGSLNEIKEISTYMVNRGYVCEKLPD